MQEPLTWKAHSLALAGPLVLWGVFLYTRGAALDVFGANLNAMLLGVIPGMSLGYFLCLMKLRPKGETGAPRAAPLAHPASSAPKASENVQPTSPPTEPDSNPKA